MAKQPDSSQMSATDLVAEREKLVLENNELRALVNQFEAEGGGKAAFEQLRRDLATSKQSVPDLQSKIETEKQEKAKLGAQLAESKKTLDGLRTSLAEVKQAHDTAVKEKQDLLNDIGSDSVGSVSDEEARLLREQLDEAKNVINRAGQREQDNLSEIEELNVRVSKLREENGKLLIEVESLRLQIQELETQQEEVSLPTKDGPVVGDEAISSDDTDKDDDV